jgi:transcriptional regulator with XRE-family HTH domain
MASKTSSSGIALLEQVSFAEGAEAAIALLQRSIGPEGVDRDIAVIDHGVPIDRLDVSQEDGISYLSFDPNPLWNLPYSIQLASFSSHGTTDFMFHEAEELLIPIEGKIMYRFFWARPNSVPSPIELDSPVAPGSMIRINPLIPHHTWAESETAQAWMVFRHPSGTPDALLIRGSGDGQPRRRVAPSDLKEPGRYAMTAWGISESIRSARSRSGLTVEQLATRVGTSASSLSRIEDARGNCSLELLQRISRILHLSFARQIRASARAFNIEPLEARSSGWTPVFDRYQQEPDHLLHSFVAKITKDENKKLGIFNTSSMMMAGTFATWIVLKGQVLLKHDDRAILLDYGKVAHFKNGPGTNQAEASGGIEVRALEDSLLVQICYSPECQCSRKES